MKRPVEGLRREGAEELHRTLERGDGVDEEAGGQAAQLVVEGFDGFAGCRGPVAAAVDVGFGQVDASGCEGLGEAGDAFFRCVFSGDAAEEMEGGIGGGDLVQQDVGQHAGTALVVGDDGGRVGAGQVDVDARDVGGAAQVVERFRVGDADDEQEFDLMGQQALDHFAFGFRIALGADDHGAEAARSGSGFEGFGQAGEEAVSVMRHDHAGQTGAGEAEAARLHVDVVADGSGGIEDAGWPWLR